MSDSIPMHPVARICTDFPTKFGIPRQSGLVPELKGRIVFEPAYRAAEAVRGLEGFSHIWLLWFFSAAAREGFRPTVRPPRLGGNVRMGVFATRSPFRPSPIGLSCVRLDAVETDGPQGPVLHVSGADLMDGTPILDIKPYLPYTDSHPEAAAGFAPAAPAPALKVADPHGLLAALPAAPRAALCAVLAQDPRPAYQHTPGRVYAFEFGGCSVRFSVDGAVLTLHTLAPLSE